MKRLHELIIGKWERIFKENILFLLSKIGTINKNECPMETKYFSMLYFINMYLLLKISERFGNTKFNSLPLPHKL